MVIGLLLIFGIYGICIAMIHLLHRFQRKEGTYRSTHCVIITLNNQLHIEWYLRSLIFVSWLRGRSIDIHIFDEGSTDETLHIARQFARERDNVQVEDSLAGLDRFIMEHRSEQIVFLQLSVLGANEKLILPQW